MTVETFTPSPTYTVSGTGPYTITHPYRAAADISVSVDVSGALPALGAADYTVSPDGSTTTGTVTLTASAATTYAGRPLRILRDTRQEQGWAGQTVREIGMEAQLDNETMALQDVDDLAGRAAFRLPVGETGGPLAAAASRALTLAGFDSAGNPELVGRSTVDTVYVTRKQFATVVQMVDDPSHFVGDLVVTLGYTASGDGGGATYQIVAAGTGVADGGTYIDLTGAGLQAHLLSNGLIAPEQFGVVDSVVNDDAMAAFFAALPGQGGALQTAATYALTRKFTIPGGDWTLKANGATLDFSGIANADTDVAGNLLAVAGSPGTPIAIASITETTNPNQTVTLDVVTTLAHGLAVNQVVLLSSDDVIDIGHDPVNEMRGQYVRVKEVVSPTAFRTYQALSEDLLTNPVMTPISWASHCSITGTLKIKGPGRRPTAAGFTGLDYTYIIDSKIEMLDTEGVDYQAISRDSCYNVRLGGIRMVFDKPGSSTAVQYGDTLKNACWACNTGLVISDGGKHPYVYTRNLLPGVARNCRVESVQATGTWHAAVAMHGNARDCSVGSVDARNCLYAVNVRAPGWRFDDIYGEDVSEVLRLTDDARDLSVGMVRGRRVAYGIRATDTNWIGTLESRNIHIGGYDFDGVSVNAIHLNFESTAVYTETDAAVTGGTTTTVTMGDFPDASKNVTGYFDEAWIKIDADGTGTGASKEIRFVTHTYAAGVNTFTWAVPIPVAPVAGTATYDLEWPGVPVFTETDAPVTGGTTTTVTMGDFPVAMYNNAGALTGSELEIDPDGGGSAVTVSRIATHTHAAGINTLTWVTPIGTAPVAGAATYFLRSYIDDVDIGPGTSKNCVGRDLYVNGNFRRLRVGEMNAVSDTVSANQSVWIDGTTRTRVKSVTFDGIQQVNKAFPLIDDHTMSVDYKARITPTQFKAVGNDVFDDTSAFQDAHDFALALNGKDGADGLRGGMVHIPQPRSKYRLNSVICNPLISWEGISADGTYMKAIDNASGHTFHVLARATSSAQANNPYPQFKNLRLNGNKGSQTATFSGIYFEPQTDDPNYRWELTFGANVTVVAGETLSQASSGASGVVQSSVTGLTVKITSPTGTFDLAGDIVGTTSGSIGVPTVVNTNVDDYKSGRLVNVEVDHYTGSNVDVLGGRAQFRCDRLQCRNGDAYGLHMSGSNDPVLVNSGFGSNAFNSCEFKAASGFIAEGCNFWSPSGRGAVSEPRALKVSNAGSASIGLCVFNDVLEITSGTPGDNVPTSITGNTFHPSDQVWAGGPINAQIVVDDVTGVVISGNNVKEGSAGQQWMNFVKVINAGEATLIYQGPSAASGRAPFSGALVNDTAKCRSIALNSDTGVTDFTGDLSVGNSTYGKTSAQIVRPSNGTVLAGQQSGFAADNFWFDVYSSGRSDLIAATELRVKNNGADTVWFNSDNTTTFFGPAVLKSYTVATLPTAVIGGMIYVSDETGGATLAISDGTNWRRAQDLAIVA